MGRLTDLKNKFLAERDKARQRSKEREYIKQMELVKKNTALKKEVEFLEAGAKLRKENAGLMMRKQKARKQRIAQQLAPIAKGFKQAKKKKGPLFGSTTKSPLTESSGGDFLDQFRKQEPKKKKTKGRKIIIEYR